MTRLTLIFLIYTCHFSIAATRVFATGSNNPENHSLIEELSSNSIEYKLHIYLDNNTRKNLIKNIIRGGVIGYLSKSAITDSMSLDKQTLIRSQELESITKHLTHKANLVDIHLKYSKKPEIHQLGKLTADEAKNPPVIESHKKTYSYLEHQIQEIVHLFSRDKRLAYLETIKLLPFFKRHRSTTPHDYAKSICLFRSLTDCAFDDGVLAIPNNIEVCFELKTASGCSHQLTTTPPVELKKAPVHFITPKQKLEGKALRHIVNLCLTETRCLSNEITAISVILDAYMKSSIINFYPTLTALVDTGAGASIVTNRICDVLNKKNISKFGDATFSSFLSPSEKKQALDLQVKTLALSAGVDEHAAQSIRNILDTCLIKGKS